MRHSFFSDIENNDDTPAHLTTFAYSVLCFTAIPKHSKFTLGAAAASLALPMIRDGDAFSCWKHGGRSQGLPCRDCSEGYANGPRPRRHGARARPRSGEFSADVRSDRREPSSPCTRTRLWGAVDRRQFSAGHRCNRLPSDWRWKTRRSRTKLPADRTLPSVAPGVSGQRQVACEGSWRRAAVPTRQRSNSITVSTWTGCPGPQTELRRLCSLEDFRSHDDEYALWRDCNRGLRRTLEAIGSGIPQTLQTSRAWRRPRQDLRSVWCSATCGDRKEKRTSRRIGSRRHFRGSGVAPSCGRRTV